MVQPIAHRHLVFVHSPPKLPFFFYSPSSDLSTCAESPRLPCIDVTTSDVSTCLRSVRTALLLPTSLSFQLKILGVRLHVLTSAICSFLQQRLSIPRTRPVPSLWLAVCKAVNSQSITSGLHWHAVYMRSILFLAPGEFASDRMLVFLNAKCWYGSWLLESLTASPSVTDVTDNPASLSCNSVPKTGQPVKKS